MASKKQDTTQLKFNHVINWLFDTAAIPPEFETNKRQLEKIVPYIHERLWTNPRITNYLNQHINDLYNIPDPIEHLKLLRKVIKLNKITGYDLWKFFPKRKRDLALEIEEREKLDPNNALVKAALINKMGIDAEGYFKPAVSKKNINLKQDIEKIKDVVDADKASKINKHEPKDSRFLSELNQEIIDSMGLLLFDTSLLKKTNQVLFTFIDKNNRKYYKVEPFVASIYISKVDGVINNDYIEEIDPKKHSLYIINDIKNYTRLKYMLTDSYTRIANGVENANYKT